MQYLICSSWKCTLNSPVLQVAEIELNMMLITCDGMEERTSTRVIEITLNNFKYISAPDMHQSQLKNFDYRAQRCI